MKLSRTTITGLVLAVVAVVLAAIVFNRPATDAGGVAGNGAAGSNANFSSSTGPSAPAPRKTARSTIVETKPMAARELELLWARGRGQELLIELDRVSATKDPDYWREIGPLLVKQAAKEGRPEIASYLLVTGDASPDDNIRIEMYAAAMNNRDEGIRTTARLELENITGQEFENAGEAQAWLEANPQPLPDDEEMEMEMEIPEDQ